MDCNIPKFDVNTGHILAPKQWLPTSNPGALLSLSPRSLTSFESAKDVHESASNLLSIVKYEYDETKNEAEQRMHLKYLDNQATYSEANQANRQTGSSNFNFSSQDQCVQQYYHVEPSVHVNANYACNYYPNNLESENNNETLQPYYPYYFCQNNPHVDYDNANDVYEQRYQHQHQLALENKQKSTDISTEIDSSSFVNSKIEEQVTLAEQVERSLTSTANTMENTLPSFNTFLN